MFFLRFSLKRFARKTDFFDILTAYLVLLRQSCSLHIFFRVRHARRVDMIISKPRQGIKKIRTRSSYFFKMVTLPRFVGSAVGDCRNSGTSEFIRIVKRQSGVPSSARKACGYDNIQTSAGHKKIRTRSSYFFKMVTLPRFELGLPP